VKYTHCSAVECRIYRNVATINHSGRVLMMDIIERLKAQTKNIYQTIRRIL